MPLHNLFVFWSVWILHIQQLGDSVVLYVAIYLCFSSALTSMLCFCAFIFILVILIIFCLVVLIVQIDTYVIVIVAQETTNKCRECSCQNKQHVIEYKWLSKKACCQIICFFIIMLNAILTLPIDWQNTLIIFIIFCKRQSSFKII